MKIRLTTIAVLALLAISAPAAFARIAPDPAGSALTLKHAAALHVAKHKVAPKTKTKTKGGTKVTKPLRPKPTLIIVAPIQSAGNSIQDDTSSYCELYMTDCTPEQLCDIWGANCSDVQNQAQSTDAVPATDSTAPGSTDSSSAGSASDASTDSSASGQSGDASATVVTQFAPMAGSDDEDC